jgi:hypothetical protein
MATTLTKTVIDTVGPSGGRVYQKTIAYETASGAYELGAATAGKRWHILGIHYGITGSHTLTILADATVIGSYSFSGGSASKDSVNTGSELFTDVGEALKVNCTTNIPVLTVTYTDDALVAWSRG